MNDLTILLATANKMPEETNEKIRQNLLLITNGQFPIVSVSQKPIDFGQNICVGDIGQSKYNEFFQILLGVRGIETKYTAVVDDDTLYSIEHFSQRPPSGKFLYERNYWFAQIGKDEYWRVADDNKKGGMWGCIAETELLIHNLETRYKKYPTDNDLPAMWGEPGKFDELYGLPKNTAYFVKSEKPCVIFIHNTAMGGVQLSRFRRRYGDPLPENKTKNLDGFGDAKDLINKYWK